jgi:hypothetical protein
MSEFTRRSALTIGATTAAALPLLAVPRQARAGMYADDAGEEIMPGIRMVALGEWPVAFGGYKRAVANDYIIGPGMGFAEEAMKNDMICQMMEGELKIVHDGMEFVGKTGHVFSCVIGTTESDHNESSAPAIMRVIDLFPT